MVASRHTSAKSMVNELLVTIARFQHSGLLMNVNEEAARIFARCPQSNVGLGQLQKMLIGRGAAAKVSLYIGDRQQVAAATKVLPVVAHKIRRRSIAISRWEDEGGAWVPHPPTAGVARSLR